MQPNFPLYGRIERVRSIMIAFRPMVGSIAEVQFGIFAQPHSQTCTHCLVSVMCMRGMCVFVIHNLLQQSHVRRQPVQCRVLLFPTVNLVQTEFVVTFRSISLFIFVGKFPLHFFREVDAVKRIARINVAVGSIIVIAVARIVTARTIVVTQAVKRKVITH